MWPSKVLGKVMITGIGDTVDTRLRQEQAGFRRGRGTFEQILILRNIIEQVIEWNANLYVFFCFLWISRRLLIALTEVFYGK